MALRIAAAIVMLVLAAFVARVSFAAAVRKGRPQAALAMAPWNARAQAAQAERLLASGLQSRTRTRAVDAARRALARDPTTVSALVTLGLEAELARDPGRAERLFALSERLSRRDLRTQVYLIEKAVRRGDVPTALRHYNVAFTTSRAARDTFFPILASAVSEPAIRRSVTGLLIRRPNWAGDFVMHIATAGPDLRAAAAIVTVLRRRGVAIDPVGTTVLVRRLLDDKRYDEAWAQYEAVRPGARRDSVRAPTFRQDGSIVTEFDWTTTNEGSLSAALPDPQARGLDVQAGPTVGGGAVGQTLLLTQGQYRIEGRARGLPAALAARPYWSLSCKDGPEVGRVVLRAGEDVAVPYAGDVVVPPDCPVQRLTLVIQPNDAIEGVSTTVESVMLRRIG